jgi:hypothetical protein
MGSEAADAGLAVFAGGDQQGSGVFPSYPVMRDM